MPILWRLFDFIANNKTAQWVLAIVSGLALYKVYERLRDNRIRRENSEKHERAAAKERERAVEYVETVREEAADAAEKAIEARDFASPLDPERMSDAKRARIFGRSRASSEGS
jgi:biopolymer transport protein ExbB/TolQ